MSDPVSLRGELLGMVELTRLIHKTPYSLVYAARAREDGRELALKVLRVTPEATLSTVTSLRRQFAHEMATVRRLDHPAIVRCLDAGLDFPLEGEARPWIAFEWLDGDTLQHALTDRVRRTPRASLDVLRPVFDALAFAHGHGVVHRDLKPGNLMRHRAAPGALKVLDFGIAKTFELGHPPTPSARTASTHVWFTPRYAAPEQFCEQATGPWTDIHALGLILVELLTARPPYGPDADTVERCEQRALSPRRPSPRDAGVVVGPWEPVLARAFALDPDQRYPSVEAFWHDLTREVPEASHAPDAPPERQPSLRRPTRQPRPGGGSDPTENR